MMNNNWGFNNPFIPQQQPMFSQSQYNYMPRYELNIVKGEAGAKNFRMAPNSKAVLVDETAPLIWFAQTDSGGYLTIEPYDIIPHKEAESVNINDLANRVKKLEEQYVQQSTSSPNTSSKLDVQSDGLLQTNSQTNQLQY